MKQTYLHVRSNALPDVPLQVDSCLFCSFCRESKADVVTGPVRDLTHHAQVTTPLWRSGQSTPSLRAGTRTAAKSTFRRPTPPRGTYTPYDHHKSTQQAQSSPHTKFSILDPEDTNHAKSPYALGGLNINRWDFAKSRKAGYDACNPPRNPLLRSEVSSPHHERITSRHAFYTDVCKEYDFLGVRL